MAKKPRFLKKIQMFVLLSFICLCIASLPACTKKIMDFVADSNKVPENNGSPSDSANISAELYEVLPNGKNFKQITIDEKFSPAITAGYQAAGGYVFQASVSGKSSGLVIMCGINDEGKIVGTKVIKSQETDSFSQSVFSLTEGCDGKYSGMSLETFEPFLVSGATLTSNAYGNAIEAALQAFAIATGVDLDPRTPEQIFQDNCNEALGTTGATFTKWFATAEVQGIDAIYESSDESGMVFVIGETFVGVKADGTIVNAGDADNAVITAAYNAIVGGKLTEITDLPDGIKKSIKKVYVAANGNYVFELSADGYQAMFEYGNGTPISIKLCISADGKIVDVLTVAHKESSGYGDACASEEYYEQYRGQGDKNIVISSKYPDHHGTDLIPSTSTDVGIIASATFTTVGYQTAIKDAFAAFKLLTAQGGE
jgi:Na+-translocating ferredoxin:NAD+ oxidoreductase RnfG subunit